MIAEQRIPAPLHRILGALGRDDRSVLSYASMEGGLRVSRDRPENDSGEPRPYGRDEVRAAILRSAHTLFGEKGPDAVSIRDVARHADISHALVHRHFGSKEQLLRAMLQQHNLEYIEAIKTISSPSEAARSMFEMLQRHPAIVRIVAHLLLSGYRPEDYVAQEGNLSALMGQFRSHKSFTGEDAQLNAAMAAAFSLGWLLFEPFILYGVGYKGDIDQIRSQVRDHIRFIAEGGGDAGLGVPEVSDSAP